MIWISFASKFIMQQIINNAANNVFKRPKRRADGGDNNISVALKYHDYNVFPVKTQFSESSYV